MRLFDAHNHLQDERLAPWIGRICGELPAAGVVAAVVNGSDESDWDAVAALARRHPWIKPSFGLHPWQVKQRSPEWKSKLLSHLDDFPDAAIGEIGLDRWIENPDIESQIECFRWQLELAAERDLPASIHCLRAWGLLDEELSSAKLPRRGFLLHSYGGSAELAPKLADLGAYFSLSPYFCHERKAKQAEVFAAVPIDRLLAESDAPDMWPPDEVNPNPLHDSQGKSLNHPANLLLSYRKLAELRGTTVEALAEQIEANFMRLFG